MVESYSPWTLDPEVTFLNHGSFGACPLAVLDAQTALRREMESEPVAFFHRTLPERLDTAREALAAFVGSPKADLVFVPNATAGLNAVLRSLELVPGDELVVTNHAYRASRNALEFVAQRSGAVVRVAHVPFPLEDAEEVVAAVLAAVGDRTRLALLDHVSSPTALIFPIERLVAELKARGVQTLVDGAHAPGMLPLDLSKVRPDYYTGNCHKWLCAPKGAAFLYVDRDRQGGIHPVSISHGLTRNEADRSRFETEFNWTGTQDFTPYLCVAEAIAQIGALRPGGWQEVYRENHRLVMQARDLLCQTLQVPLPAPSDMIGSMAAIPLPDGRPEPAEIDPLQDELFHGFGIEVPVIPWPGPPNRLLRISGHLYNTPGQYVRLTEALQLALNRG